MIELFLSSDGKHTVHVAADTLEQLATLVPVAKKLYRQIVAEFGSKVQMWGPVMNRGSHRFHRVIRTAADARQVVGQQAAV